MWLVKCDMNSIDKVCRAVIEPHKDNFQWSYQGIAYNHATFLSSFSSAYKGKILHAEFSYISFNVLICIEYRSYFERQPICLIDIMLFDLLYVKHCVDTICH